MRLVAYNIQYGKGKDGAYDLSRLAAEIGDADLIALQEVETNTPRSGMVDQPAALGAFFPGHYRVFGPGIDTDASTVEGGQVINRRRQHGNMVLSRWPILSVIVHTLPKMALTTAFHQQRVMVETVIAAPQGPLRFVSVHFDHVGPQTRLPQVRAALDLLIAQGPARGAVWGGPLPDAAGVTEVPPPCPRPVIVMGDFNFTPASEEYRLMCGDRHPRFGVLTRDGGLVDAWVSAGHDVDAGISHPGAGARIDHCMVTSDLAAAVRAARIDMEAEGSDHQPLFVDLDDAALARILA